MNKNKGAKNSKALQRLQRSQIKSWNQSGIHEPITYPDQKLNDLLWGCFFPCHPFFRVLQVFLKDLCPWLNQELAQAAQKVSTNEIRKLRENLERAQGETEELRKQVTAYAKCAIL